MVRILSKSAFKKMHKGPYRLDKRAKSNVVKICKACKIQKNIILFDGCGISNTCKECANTVSKQKREYKRNNWCVDIECPICNVIFKPYLPSQRFCSIKCNKSKYKEWKIKDPIKYRAFCMTNTLIGIKNKIQTGINLLNGSIGNKCKYCDIILHIGNCSLDHKIPMMRNNNLTKEREISLNQINNLQIICKRCNTLKSSFTDEEYTKIVKFCNTNIELGEKLMIRLIRSNAMWGKRFKN